jgi:hypothetical protein
MGSRLRAQLVLAAAAYSATATAMAILNAMIWADQRNGIFWSAMGVLAIVSGALAHLAARTATKVRARLGAERVRLLVAPAAALGIAGLWIRWLPVLGVLPDVVNAVTLLLLGSLLFRPLRWEQVR